jgi:hypothetical protein
MLAIVQASLGEHEELIEENDLFPAWIAEEYDPDVESEAIHGGVTRKRLIVFAPDAGRASG